MIESTSALDSSSVILPEIETDVMDPVIVGRDEGITVSGETDGMALGNKVGAAVMYTSQQRNGFETFFEKQYHRGCISVG